jgi:hypothetical protein
VPLDKAKLKTALQTIFEDLQRPYDDVDAPKGKSVWFDFDVGSASDTADLWSAAVASYAFDVTQGGTGAVTGAGPLKTGLTAAFEAMPEPAPPPPAAPPEPPAFELMETAFKTFAAAVGLGMKSTVPIPFTAVPPAGKVGFASVLAEPATTEEAATAASDAIDAWMKTGTATPDAPPGSAATPWI